MTKVLILNPKQSAQARRRIRKYYGLARLPKDEVVLAEIQNLYRKAEAGTLDDFQEDLLASLETGQHPIPEAPHYKPSGDE